MSYHMGGFQLSIIMRFVTSQPHILLKSATILLLSPHSNRSVWKVCMTSCTTNTDDRAHVDVRTRGSWNVSQDAFFDVLFKCMHPPTVHQTSALSTGDTDKPRKGNTDQWIREVERGVFTCLTGFQFPHSEHPSCAFEAADLLSTILFMGQILPWKTLRDKSPLTIFKHFQLCTWLWYSLTHMLHNLLGWHAMNFIVVSANGYTHLLCWQYTRLQKFSRMPWCFVEFKSLFEQCRAAHGKKLINWTEWSIGIAFSTEKGRFGYVLATDDETLVHLQCNQCKHYSDCSIWPDSLLDEYTHFTLSSVGPGFCSTFPHTCKSNRTKTMLIPRRWKTLSEKNEHDIDCKTVQDKRILLATILSPGSPSWNGRRE